MEIPMTWLKEYVDIDLENINEFDHKMTMSGSKVEEVIRFGEGVEGIVVGKVLSIEKHPDADKLVITQIDVGDGNNRQIVTGATNLTVGDYVPVALHGSKVIGGKVIKRGSLRGQLSDGMLCSIEELGYTIQDYPDAAEDGIYVLDKPYELGADIVPILQIKENVVSFEITSNRPDCFSVLGLSREAAATFKKPFNPPQIVVKEEANDDITKIVDVEIKNSELCPRYIARVVKNVKIGHSPLWLRHRLTTAGIRPINNIVDITNYVMLEFGQPMHAFDISAIAKHEGVHKIIVRNANDGEKFKTLDGVERTLDSSMLVIADCEKAVALAGVMGGENSKITETGAEAMVLFESANFNGVNVRTTSKKVGLRTDASAKYEKGLDPNLAEAAVNRAVQLVEMLECGTVVKGCVDNYPNKREGWSVNFDLDRINSVLVTDLKTEDVATLLKPLEIEVSGNTAKIPTFRPDITMEADLMEEIARLYGYDNIKETLATGTPTVGKKSFKQKVEDIIKNTMVSFGLYEALHFAFESPKVFDKLNIEQNDKLRNAIPIKNPLGEDFSIMRTTTLNSMLTSLQTNFNRRNPEAYLFELSKTYEAKSLPLSEQPYEPEILTIGFYGKKDFYHLKGMAEGLFQTLGVSGITFERCKDLVFMHPGRTASIIGKDGQNVGYIGEVHPSVLSNYEIETKAYIGVINAEYLYENANLEKIFEPLPKFPGVLRDIAMVVKKDVPVSEIERAIYAKGGNILRKATLFDVYSGKQIAEGFKSVAYSLMFRSDEKTLNDEEVSKVLRKIITNLEFTVEAQLRDK